MWVKIAIILVGALLQEAAERFAPGPTKALGFDPVTQQHNVISQDDIRAKAIQIAGPPTNDEQRAAIEHLVGFATAILESADVMWPTYQRGDKRGQKVEPMYLTFDFTQGRAWVHHRYYSKKSVDAGYRRGRRHGERAGKAEMSQQASVTSS